jgi:cephalosporin-C deacetylase-like acetyl esterase
MKFVKSEKPTDEEFEQFWRKAVKKRISKILEGTG